MKIIHVPIEPYDRRYTRDWIKQFENCFDKQHQMFFTVMGEINGLELKADTVLDACGTNYFKLTQLQKIIKMIQSGFIKDGDVIFFADLWFPGIESLFYIRDMLKINFKIAGILHAGTWDTADFTCRYGMRDWGHYFEEALFYGVDMVFVATEFHKQLIINDTYNKERDKKIFVTGIPFFGKELRKNHANFGKENIVVFPHRIAPEKHPEMFDNLEIAFRTIAKDMPDVRFIKTIDVTKDSKEYFDLLAKSKVVVSFADQETFGYSVVESVALGCLPIVPNALSYKETIHQDFRYNNIADKHNLASVVRDRLKKYDEYREHYGDTLIQNQSKWENSINFMVYYMRSISDEPMKVKNV
jgi:glycosyltransferase involved in cell wall biosynthesis